MLVADGRAQSTSLLVPPSAGGIVPGDPRIVGLILTDLCGHRATFGDAG